MGTTTRLGQSCILPAAQYFEDHPWVHSHLRKSNKRLKASGKVAGGPLSAQPRSPVIMAPVSFVW